MSIPKHFHCPRCELPTQLKYIVTGSPKYPDGWWVCYDCFKEGLPGNWKLQKAIK